MSLNFSQLREANVSRCEASFHPVRSWSPTDWATALAGECGEACNFVKKLRRMNEPDAPYNLRETRGHSMSDAPCSACGDLDGCHVPARLDREARDINANIGRELADLVTYADLLAARIGIDLGAAVAAKFNEVSDRVGSPIKLDADGLTESPAPHGDVDADLVKALEVARTHLRWHCNNSVSELNDYDAVNGISTALTRATATTA